MDQNKKGKIFALIGPTSVGKNTLLEEMTKRIPGLIRMPSATERLPREGEVHGRDKFFLTQEEFDQAVKEDQFLEWQWVHGNRYGVLKKVLEDRINAGEDYLCDIEVLGAMKLKELYGDDIVLIFVFPPNLKTLKDRIEARDTDSEESKRVRLGRIKAELAFATKCDRGLLNDDLGKAYDDLNEIIRKSKEGAQGDFGVEIWANGLVPNSQGDFLIFESKDGGWKIPQKEAALGGFPHQGLAEMLSEKLDCTLKTVKDRRFAAKENRDLKIAQPIWCDFQKKSEGLRVDYFYYFKELADYQGNDQIWISREEVFDKLGKDFQAEMREVL